LFAAGARKTSARSISFLTSIPVTQQSAITLVVLFLRIITTFSIKLPFDVSSV
jgi:hypothetical protein